MFHCHKTFIMSLLFMQRCERRSYNPVPCDDSNDNYEDYDSNGFNDLNFDDHKHKCKCNDDIICTIA